ncbi:MAG: hypothetical protein U1E30_18820 [Rhodoblastus sp.]
MTALDSLKKRAGVLVAGGVSFALVLVVMRWSAGDPLVQPKSDIGVLIGLVLVAVYFVITDTRDGGKADAPKGLN